MAEQVGRNLPTSPAGYAKKPLILSEQRLLYSGGDRSIRIFDTIHHPKPLISKPFFAAT
jgi:hypothetical protein